MNDITSLLGLAADSKGVQDCVTQFGEVSDVYDCGDVVYHSYYGRGICFLFGNQKLRSVMFYSDGLEGFSGFSGCLPFGITFQDSKLTVEQKVGVQAVSSGSVRVPFPGKRESNWIKFRFEKFALHIEFSSSACEAIRLVTVMAPKPSDGLN
jgi:hypothetical protein